MYTYRQIFKQAFKIAWQNPGLWFFGFFVALLGSTGDLELFLGSYNFGGEDILFSFLGALAEGGLFTVAGIQGISKILFTNPVYLFFITLIFLFILGLAVLIIWLVTVSQAALIGQAISISKNKKLSWRQSFELGLMKFWPVLGLSILMRFIVGFVFILTGILTFLKFSGSIFVFIISFDIFLLLVLIVSFIIKYAICGVVIKDLKFVQALKAAGKVFVKNWLLSLEIAIILFGIYLLVNSLLAWLIALILFYFLRVFASFIFGIILLFLLLIVIFIAIQILLVIFHWATWTIVFELLTNPKTVLVSRLKSGFKKLTSPSG